MQARLDFLKQFAVALGGNFNEESWKIEVPPDVKLIKEFMANVDETIFGFDWKKMKVYGPAYLRRLESKALLKFTGRHCSFTPVVTAEDKVIASTFIFSHTKNGSKMTSDFKKHADETQQAIAELQ